jgi:O-antigen ligase
MKLDLSQSKNSLSLLEPVRILEPLWVIAALLLFSVRPQRGIWIAAGLTLLALSFLQRRATTGRSSRPTAFDVPCALLLVGALVGLWASYDAKLSLPAFFILTGSIALYYAVANAPKPMALAQAALLVGLAVATYFLTQYQYIPHVDKSGLASSLGRVTSALFPRVGSWTPFSNGVATLLAGLIPLGAGLTVAGGSRGWRIFNGVATGVMALAVLVAASRGAWVALLVAGAFWLAGRWQRGVIVLAVAALVALAALIGYLALVEGATLAGIPVVGPVLYQFFARPDRLEVYQGSLRLLQSFPLTGIGLGEVFALVYSKYVLLIPHAFLTYSHNLYLTIWLGHGLLGVIGIGWLLAAFGSLVVRGAKKWRSSALFQAGGAGLVAIFVHGLFDARQYVDFWTMWPLFVLLGLVASASRIAGEAETAEARRTARSRRWEWVAVGLLAVGCVLVWRPLFAAAFANLGAVRQARAELAPELREDTKTDYLRTATANYVRALQLAPRNQTANLRLGNLAVAEGRYEEGVVYLEVVWQAAPNDPTARKALGLAYTWVGEIDKAAQLLGDAKDIISELNTWGWWHSQEGRQQVAANAYRTSLALRPDQPQVRDLLATLESK